MSSRHPVLLLVVLHEGVLFLFSFDVDLRGAFRTNFRSKLGFCPKEGGGGGLTQSQLFKTTTIHGTAFMLKYCKHIWFIEMFFFLLKNLCSFQFSVFITIIHLCKYVWQQRKSLTNCFHGKIPFTKIWMRLPCSSWKFFLLLQGKKMSPWKQQVLVLELLCSL